MAPDPAEPLAPAEPYESFDGDADTERDSTERNRPMPSGHEADPDSDRDLARAVGVFFVAYTPRHA
jgi:hypothetical protein